MPFNPSLSRLASALIAAAGLSGVACADDAGGAYVGGQFGRAHNTYDTGFIDSAVASTATANGETVSYQSRSVQRLSDVWWVDAGYLFNPYVGLEAEFFHLGEVKYESSGTLATSTGNESIDSKTEVTSHGPALSLRLRLPLTESFEADLRVGDYYGKAKADALVTVGSNGGPGSASKSTSSLLVGVGVAYTLAAHWSLRGDVLRVNKTGDDGTTGTFSVNLVTLGASYTF
jgi:opacity protein-like surface antigen